MPATSNSIYTDTITALAVITEHLAVDYLGNLATAAVAMMGIAVTDAAIGDDFAVEQIGTAVATAGAAIADGAELEVGAAGKLITKAAGVVVARARQAAAADGDLLEVFLLPK